MEFPLLYSHNVSMHFILLKYQTIIKMSMRSPSIMSHKENELQTFHYGDKQIFCMLMLLFGTVFLSLLFSIFERVTSRLWSSMIVWLHFLDPTSNLDGLDNAPKFI